METAFQIWNLKDAVNRTERDRNQQCVLLDWGDTVMRVFPDYSGPMETWPEVELVPGVDAAIHELRNHALVCLATNAADSDERAINTALARVGVDKLFDSIFCFRKLGFRKPSGEYFRAVLNSLALPSSKVFMVGDDFDVDVLGATAVSIPSVWMNLHTDEKRSGPKYTTAHSFGTLINSLEGLGFIRV